MHRIKIVEIQEIELDSWDGLLKSSPVATWFQTPEAYRFFNSLSFVEAFALGVKNDGILKGVVVGYVQQDGGRLKQFLSRRAIITGGPLFAEDITDEEVKSLLDALQMRLKRKAIYIETRNFNDYNRWRTAFDECGFRYEQHYDVIVDTSSIDEVYGRLDRNRKRNIKKAIENGIVIDKNPSETDIKVFYSLLDELYRTKVKTPLFPYEFFEKLRALPASLFCIAKDLEGKVIGGLVCVAQTGNAVYAWFACGDDTQYKKLSPSVMANYAGICHAAENGFAKFDFMGAGKPNDSGYGVRDFKMKFGGELKELGRYIHVCNPLLYNMGRLAVIIMKKL
jgi:hypothetical protein